MKAITLWQPWAILIALGEKRYETRSWTTNYRGPLVIHAAKKKDAEINEYCAIPEIKAVLDKHGLHFDNLPYGAGLCICMLPDIEKTWRMQRYLTDQEAAFGDFSVGRYAWRIAPPIRVFLEPIPCQGAQGLWEWTIPLPEEVKL